MTTDDVAADAFFDSAKTLEALAPLLQARRYRAGQVLWTEGERSGRLVVIDAGRIKAVRTPLCQDSCCLG